MSYSRNAIKKTWTIVSIVLALFAIVAANYFNFFNDFINLLGIDDKQSTYASIINISIKVILILTAIIIWCIFYISFLWVFEWNSLSLKNHAISSLTKKIIKTKDFRNLTVFGYSISFAEDIRFNISKGEKTNLNIHLIVPSGSYIESTLSDDQTKESRIAELNARIIQWEKLKSTERIQNIEIKRVNSIPVENGFFVNDETIYIDYYKWNDTGNGFKLEKKPKNERGFLKIESKQKDLFNYIKYQLSTK